MTLGEKIKLQRKKHDMSQRDMAERLFVSRQAVSKWEADKGIPDIENLRQIAALFNISLDYLINDEAKDDDIMYSFREDRGERILRIILKAVLLLVILFMFGSINAYFYSWADNAGFDEAKTDAARLYMRIAEAAVAGLLAGSIIAEFTGRRLKYAKGFILLLQVSQELHGFLSRLYTLQQFPEFLRPYSCFRNITDLQGGKNAKNLRLQRWRLLLSQL